MLILLLWQGGHAALANAVPQLDRAKFDPTCGVAIQQSGDLITVTWPIDRDGGHARWTFDLAPSSPVIRAIEIAKGKGMPFSTIAGDLEPVYLLRTGKRELDERGGWTVFFDRMQNKSHETHHAALSKSSAVARSHHQRATLSIGPFNAGLFTGELRWTFYVGEAFVLQEAVVRTEQDAVAYLYDAGVVCRTNAPKQVCWTNTSKELENAAPAEVQTARHVPVLGRAIAAEFGAGSLAVFPPPHRYFYPLDYSTNLLNIWFGPGYADSKAPFGLGFRHDPRGDNRFVPWFNAPPGTDQELGLFWWISDSPAETALSDVARFTRGDRFEHLPGHVTFASHFHVEHTQAVLDAQKEKPADEDAAAVTPAGNEYRLPRRLQDPGFVRVFRDMGLDVVHSAEFHFGHTPHLGTEERLCNLDLLHAECARLSDDKLLLLPGEEPNVHLGGHWISLFPKPIHWVLNRPEGTPFVTDRGKQGKVYHVGSEADIYRLLQSVRGLAWTAHPRIKSSAGFPDAYRDSTVYQSDRFLGAAWKAMPADLSQPRLGSRVLDLLDDMSNWGVPKYVLGEVDVFQIEPDHELYGHMNVNYLKLEKAPKFTESWEPILNALRRGQFFVTTGEVLITDYSLGERTSGETAAVPENGAMELSFTLRWTFPLAYAEIVTGDGMTTRRQRVDLSRTHSFGQETFKAPVELGGQRWIRLEVWDVATNGAFTQPIWLNKP